MASYGLSEFFFALSSKSPQAICTKMTVEKVYSKHIISPLNEFAEQMIQLGLLDNGIGLCFGLFHPKSENEHYQCFSCILSLVSLVTVKQ